MTIVSEPKIEERKEQPYMGIRTQTPMAGMSKVVTKLFKEMNAWSRNHNLKAVGAPFLRFHVVDMEGEMDIEAGIPVETPVKEDRWVTAGVLPAGRYASLIYTGSGYTGNKTLIDWARTKGIAWDRWNDPKGDAFCSRYESYLTDPKIEPHKTKWQIEVAIKLLDNQPK